MSTSPARLYDDAVDAEIALNDLLVAQALLVRSSMLRYRRLDDLGEKRETSLTEELMQGLQELGPGLVKVLKAPGPESKYGADLELWLRGSGYVTGLRLQAKSLHPRKKSDGVYGSLHHRVGKKRIPQVSLLIENTEPPLNPGYIFYNGLEKKPKARSACCSFDGYGARNGKLGITFCGAEAVQVLDSTEPRRNALDDVLPECVPINCLALCRAYYVPPGWRVDPISANRLPLRLAGISSSWISRDPGRQSPSGVNPRILEMGRRMFEGQLPHYVLDLLLGDAAPQEFEPTAAFVAIIDGDALGDSVA